MQNAFAFPGIVKLQYSHMSMIMISICAGIIDGVVASFGIVCNAK